MSQKTLDEYQAWIADTSWYQHAGERNSKEAAYLVLGLCGESGEFADEFKKIVREIGFDDLEGYKDLVGENQLHLIDELGDVLWYLVQLCSILGISLEKLMAFNAYKLTHRLAENYRYEEIAWPFSDPMLAEHNVDNMRKLLTKGGG